MTVPRPTLFVLVLLFAAGSTGVALDNSALAATQGKIISGPLHAPPDWFKESFLEIADDVDEAGDVGKHVLLFFELNNCPYCDRMLTESFETDPYMSFIREHFDVIAINVDGDREVAFNDEISVLEKELAEMLKVFATPALIFLGADNRQVVRVNGYRAAPRFQQVLSYVSSKSYQQVTLAEYLDNNLEQQVYTLRDHELFADTTDLSQVKGLLAVIFENGSCFDCNELHDRLLTREDVLGEFRQFTVVRLDTDSTETAVDVDGAVTSAAALALKHGMTYRPGVLLFDEGKLVGRYDSLAFSYHFREGLRYISGGFYKHEDRQSYLERRMAELLASGVDVNLTN